MVTVAEGCVDAEPDQFAQSPAFVVPAGFGGGGSGSGMTARRHVGVFAWPAQSRFEQQYLCPVAHAIVLGAHTAAPAAAPQQALFVPAHVTAPQWSTPLESQ